MTIFVVILDADGVEAAPKVKDHLEGRFPGVYEFTPTCFLVSGNALTQEVAAAGGLHSTDLLGEGTSGAVFRINGYGGYTDPSLWEWLTNTKGE